MFHDPKNPWIAMLLDEKYGQSAIALREYLALVDSSESPRAYHVWSLISMASASMRRRTWVSLGGVGSILPNQYVILIGPPALRKSSAITMVEQFTWPAGVKLGPGDTSGQRHGLMVAFMGTRRFAPNPKRLEAILPLPASLEDVANLDTDMIADSLPKGEVNSDIYLMSKELSRLIMNQDRGMIDFLTDLYDGESVDYQTKQGSIKIKKPSLNLLGATTPTSLASCMPRGASDHGILSRIIFVYSSTPYRDLPRPAPYGPKELEFKERLEHRLTKTAEYEGPFTETDGAASLYDSLYTYRPRILDSRFNGYAGRRAIHLRKLMLCLAALRTTGDQKIIESDVQLAHDILALTEKEMSHALMALGGNQLHLGKYLMIEYLRDAGIATTEDLYRVASTELRRNDARQAVEELLSNGILGVIGDNMIALREVIEEKRRSSTQSGGPKPPVQESS